MGESKNNPRARDFRGELPDVMPGAEMTWIVVPSEAFLKQMAEMKEAGVEGPMVCREADRDVVLVAIAKWIVPSKITEQWPMSQLQMAEIARMPLIAFKKAHKANFVASGMLGIAAGIIVPEENLLAGE